MDTPDDTDRLPDREIFFTDMLRFPKMLLWATVTWVGIALFTLPFLEFKGEFVDVFKKFVLPLFGLAVAGVGTILLRAEIRKRRGFVGERFVDVDERIRKEGRAEEVLVREAVARAMGTSHAEGVSDQKIPETKSQVEQYDFLSYFGSIRDVLERKASIADEKASILLDKGVAYSRFGIFVFVVSIIAWQLITWKAGFKMQHIYGIASCTVLFIVIEFLSAWFLKQYRHFVDTSTYLIKVKSIFDRYMLSYHVASEFDNLDQEDRASSQLGAVLTLLRDDIKWPDDYLYKSADVSFAREMMQSLAEIAKAGRKPTAKD